MKTHTNRTVPEYMVWFVLDYEELSQLQNSFDRLILPLAVSVAESFFCYVSFKLCRWNLGQKECILKDFYKYT